MTSEDLLTHDWHGRAETLLREQEELFRALADNVPQLVSIADANGETRWYNKAWYEFTGTTFDQVEGWQWQSVHHPDHLPAIVERVRRSIRSGTPWEDAVPLRGRGGTYHWFMTRLAPIRDAQGRITHWLATGTSIAGLTGVQPVRAAAGGSAGDQSPVGLFRWKHNGVVAEANDAFCRMLGVTPADVRAGWVNLRLCTPREWREIDAHKELELTAQGTTTSWEKEFFAADGRRVPVVVAATPCDADPGCWVGVCVDMRPEPGGNGRNDHALRLAAVGMSHLATDVVDMTRIATGTLQLQPECVEVRPYFAGIVGMFEGAARGRDITLHCDVDGSAPPRMSADRQRLARAIANLLDNAVRFTPPGGEVRLSVRGTGLRQTHLEVAIQDTGPGIAPPDLARILDRCRQPDRATSGPGFGIPVASGIIVAHGGVLDADSDVGGGTTVVVTLPIVPPDTQSSDEGGPSRLLTPTRMLSFPTRRLRPSE